jgi:tRNA threonylcarbamoyladenosine biosynthesis protein TsaB
MADLVLALDTSTPRLSCALLRRDDAGVAVLGTRESEPPEIVSTLVPLAFEELLQDAGATLDDVGVLVAGLGPGLFTGTRVAVATMKAIAYARRWPLLGADTLEAMSLAAARGAELRAGDSLRFDAALESGELLATLDARKGEVYFGRYRWREGELLVLEPPAAGAPMALFARVKAAGETTLAFGSGLTAMGVSLEPAKELRFTGIPRTPGAAELAWLALRGEPRPAYELAAVLGLEPVYLRPPEAEVARRKRETKGS